MHSVYLPNQASDLSSAVSFFTISSQCVVFPRMVKPLQNAPSYLSNAVHGKKNSSVVPRGHQHMP